MQAITDNQHVEIWDAMNNAYMEAIQSAGSVREAQAAGGRAAIAQAAPYLLAEPTPKELRAADKGPGQPWQETVQQAFANRLAQYTVKPDPRREAVLDELNAYLGASDFPDSRKDLADRILARIDAAGGKQ